VGYFLWRIGFGERTHVRQTGDSRFGAARHAPIRAKRGRKHAKACFRQSHPALRQALRIAQGARFRRSTGPAHGRERSERSERSEDEKQPKVFAARNGPPDHYVGLRPTAPHFSQSHQAPSNPTSSQPIFVNGPALRLCSGCWLLGAGRAHDC
jgi:hypothetical protein